MTPNWNVGQVWGFLRLIFEGEKGIQRVKIVYWIMLRSRQSQGEVMGNLYKVPPEQRIDTFY